RLLGQEGGRAQRDRRQAGADGRWPQPLGELLMIRSAFFSVLAFALGGCLTIPEGVFACLDASECPEGFDCAGGFCVEEGNGAMRQCDDGSATLLLTRFCDGVDDCDD